MAQPPILTHRIATKDELPLLIRFREECGYGLPGLMKGINDPDRIYCVFMMDIDGEKRDVGMACWYLHQPDNLDLACRDTGIVLIAALFISNQYQGRKIGSAAMDLLERVAVSDFGANVVTLDTLAYETTTCQPEDGTPSYVVENFEKEGKLIGWYRARGYRQLNQLKPLFPYPLPDDPNRLLTAIFMSKSAEAIRSEQEGKGP